MMQIDVGYAIGAFLSWVIWQVSIEFRMRALKKDHDDHTVHVSKNDIVIWNKIEAISNTMTEVMKSLGRIEGRLGVRNEP